MVFKNKTISDMIASLLFKRDHFKRATARPITVLLLSLISIMHLASGKSNFNEKTAVIFD